MNYGAGSLTIAARRAGTRTVLERIRYDGISRCSRAFAHGDAALVVLSVLGPGVVRGDSITAHGHVRTGAHLIVTNQAATRILGGTLKSHSRAAWTVDDGAVLELVGEPLIAAADAHFEASTAIELRAESFVLMSELASVAAGANVRLRTSVTRSGRELFYDAYDATVAAPGVVGTFTCIGLPAQSVDAVVAALDRIADANHGAKIGVGALRCGAFARILGTDIWTVRSILGALREASRTAVSASPRPFAQALPLERAAVI